MAKDLFGNDIIESVLLRDKFLENPFSVLDAKQGGWQNRKRQWLDLGIKSEMGRDDVPNMIYGTNKIDPRENYSGKSVFDSALTELMYRWFCPDNGTILDPFAGGSVRGVVANYLGYKYTGIELSERQVEANKAQAKQIIPDNQPTWICGDSDKELDKISEQFDFVFSCPPYFDLEVYSDLPDDLSNMTYEDFLVSYGSIIKKSINHLKSGGFAVFVVGEVRDKEGYYRDFVGDTKRLFMANGAKFYNDMILLENGLNTAAMRADKQFTSGKKVVKIHQNVLCFKKI